MVIILRFLYPKQNRDCCFLGTKHLAISLAGNQFDISSWSMLVILFFSSPFCLCPARYYTEHTDLQTLNDSLILSLATLICTRWPSCLVQSSENILKDSARHYAYSSDISPPPANYHPSRSDRVPHALTVAFILPFCCTILKNCVDSHIVYHCFCCVILQFICRLSRHIIPFQVICIFRPCFAVVLDLFVPEKFSFSGLEAGSSIQAKCSLKALHWYARTRFMISWIGFALRLLYNFRYWPQEEVHRSSGDHRLMVLHDIAVGLYLEAQRMYV